MHKGDGSQHMLALRELVGEKRFTLWRIKKAVPRDCLFIERLIVNQAATR